MEIPDGICHFFLSYFLKCVTTKSIKLHTSTQKATHSTLDELYHPSNSP